MIDAMDSVPGHFSWEGLDDPRQKPRDIKVGDVLTAGPVGAQAVQKYMLWIPWLG